MNLDQRLSPREIAASCAVALLLMLASADMRELLGIHIGAPSAADPAATDEPAADDGAADAQGAPAPARLPEMNPGHAANMDLIDRAAAQPVGEGLNAIRNSGYTELDRASYRNYCTGEGNSVRACDAAFACLERSVPYGDYIVMGTLGIAGVDETVMSNVRACHAPLR